VQYSEITFPAVGVGYKPSIPVVVKKLPKVLFLILYKKSGDIDLTPSCNGNASIYYSNVIAFVSSSISFNLFAGTSVYRTL